MARAQNNQSERSPLLRRSESNSSSDDTEVGVQAAWCTNRTLTMLQTIDFSEEDDENPRDWSSSKKLANVGVIALVGSAHLLSRLLVWH